MEYRQAGLRDLDAIANLHAKSWQETYKDILASSYLENNVLEDRYAIWNQRLKAPSESQLILIAKDEVKDEVAGFICIETNIREKKAGILLDNLHVAESFKGKGIGKKLILNALSHLDNLESIGLYLEVLAENKAAIRFYEKLGGIKADEGVWSAPCGTQVNEIIYTWERVNKLRLNLLE